MSIPLFVLEVTKHPFLCLFIIGRDAVGKVIDAGEKPVSLKWENGFGPIAWAMEAVKELPVHSLPFQRSACFACRKTVIHCNLFASVHSAATAAILLKDVLNLSGERTLLIEGRRGAFRKEVDSDCL